MHLQAVVSFGLIKGECKKLLFVFLLCIAFCVPFCALFTTQIFALILFYESFLFVLDYSDVIYKNAAPSILKPFDTVCHSALRFISSENYRTHHCFLYARVCWPSLADRRNKHLVPVHFKGN